MLLFSLPKHCRLFSNVWTVFKRNRRTRHAGHCWRSKDELISDVLLWTPAYGQAKAGQPAQTYIQQLCEDMGCSPEDLPEEMNDREKWRERVRDIRAGGTTWWWWCFHMEYCLHWNSWNFFLFQDYKFICRLTIIFYFPIFLTQLLPELFKGKICNFSLQISMDAFHKYCMYNLRLIENFSVQGVSEKLV